MENDKIFQLLTKMYGEVNSRFDLLEKDIKDVKQDLGSVKQNVNSMYAKIDGDIDDKLKSLGDGYKVNYDIATEIRDKVEQSSKDVDDLNMALFEIKDDVNYIANKTIRQDGRLNKMDKEIKNKPTT